MHGASNPVIGGGGGAPPPAPQPMVMGLQYGKRMVEKAFCSEMVKGKAFKGTVI